MLQAFVDDSGSGGDSSWYVLAGYIGTSEKWASFEPAWLEALKAHPSVPFFKASEAESCRREHWFGVSPQQRDSKIDELIAVIGRYAERAVCVRMRQRDYDELVKGKLPMLPNGKYPLEWDRPYYLLATIMVGAAINIDRLDGTHEPMEVVFDMDETHKKGFANMLPHLPAMAMTWGKLTNVRRADEKTTPALQAADLLAWQIRRFFSVTTEPQRRHFRAALDAPPEEPHTFVLDRQKIRELMSDMHANAAKLRKH